MYGHVVTMMAAPIQHTAHRRPDEASRRDCCMKWALGLAAALPLVAVVAIMIRLEAAFAQPEEMSALVPGVWPLTGDAKTFGIHWINFIVLSGNAAILSWCVFLVRVRRWLFPDDAALRDSIPALAAVAVMLATAGALSLAERHGEGEAWAFFLFIFAPTLTVSYALLWDAVRRFDRLWLSGLVLAGFPTLTFSLQLRHEQPGASEESVIVLNSVLLAVSIGVWLYAWGYAPNVAPGSRRAGGRSGQSLCGQEETWHHTARSDATRSQPFDRAPASLISERTLRS